MAYIWGSSKAPDYLSAGRTLENISREIASCLVQGKKIDEKYLIYEMGTPSEKKALMLKDKLYQWDELNSNTGAKIVNQKVLDILERECAGKFQAIPAIINLHDGSKIRDYFAINVTHKSSLFSLDNSIKYDEYINDNKIRGFIFKTTAFKESIIDQEDLCKDTTIMDRTIFISERLRKIFRKEKIKGPQFWKNLRDSVIFV